MLLNSINSAETSALYIQNITKRLCMHKGMFGGGEWILNIGESGGKLCQLGNAIKPLTGDALNKEQREVGKAL